MPQQAAASLSLSLDILKEVYTKMNNKAYYILKTLLFVFSFYMTLHFVGNQEYDYKNNCSLTDAGGMLALFLIFCFSLLFYEKMRNKIIDLLKIYISAFFILYSAVYYMDSIQHEQEILGQKNFIEIQIKYIELLDKNISNQYLLNKLTSNLNNMNKPFDKYVNKTLFQYKDIVGRSMMGLTIGMFTIIMLEVLAYIFRRQEKISNKTLHNT